MINKSKNKNIINNIICRKLNLKKKIQTNNILIKNNNINIKHKLVALLSNNNINISKNKVCLVTGRYKALNKKLNLTRQIINQYSIKNKLDNINIASW